jgi:hypothetical protein
VEGANRHIDIREKNWENSEKGNDKGGDQGESNEYMSGCN